LLSVYSTLIPVSRKMEPEETAVKAKYTQTAVVQKISECICAARKPRNSETHKNMQQPDSTRSPSCWHRSAPSYAQLPPPILPLPSLSPPGVSPGRQLVETGLLLPGSRGHHALRSSGLLLIFRRSRIWYTGNLCGIVSSFRISKVICIFYCGISSLFSIM
jgi:hypothetical protein